MAAGDATAADVPGRYDVVINGKGYCFADSVEPSLPFRTHRAIYDITPTFVNRQNVSQAYGDQFQDFFLTETQHDWSLGGTQLFLDAEDQTSRSKFWSSSGMDISIPGQAGIMRDFTRITNEHNPIAMSNGPTFGTFYYRASGATTALKTVTTTGTVTSLGDPGAGGQNQWGLCTDGVNVYIAGGTSIRKWNGAAFSTFSATASAGALAFLNNTLFSCDGVTLKSYDGAGNSTTLFTWKDATNTPLNLNLNPKLVPFGGKLLIFFPFLDRQPKLFIYDGSGVSLVATLPVGSLGYDVAELDGIVFMSAGIYDLPGGLNSNSGGTVGTLPVIYYWANGNLGELWRSTSSIGFPVKNLFGLPALCVFSGRLVFATTRQVYYYTPGTGAIWQLGTVPVDSTPLSGSGYEMLVSDPAGFMYGESSSGRIDQRIWPGTTYQAVGQVVTSWFDFGNSLTKSFRGVKIDFDKLGSGAVFGTLDIQYEIDDGGIQTLQTGATSGTEYIFPANTTGRKIRITLNSNFGSVAAPIIKRIYVRAAPELQQFKSGLYIIDCTGSPEEPRQLRDGSDHPLTGYDQVQNLLVAAKSTTPISVTDKINGTFNALVDLSDQEGWDVYEVHPNTENREKPGSYFVRVKVREV